MNYRLLVKRIAAAALICTLIAGIFTGCGSSDEKKGISVYIGGTIFESSLDPVKGAMSYGYSFTNDCLLEVAPDSSYTGCLAENDWKISNDGLTYTFNLKKGIKFHDGSDFTAEDVVFTYNQVKENPGVNENIDLTNLEAVQADGDYTVIFKLKKPYSSFIDQTACLGIVPSDSYDSETFDTMPIGTGPWKVVQYDTAQKIIVEANTDYFNGAASIPQVNILNMEQDTAIANAKSGQLDVIMVDPNYIDEKIDGMHIESLETMDVRQISLPTKPESEYTTEDGKTMTIGNDVTSDKAVRKALAIGIDRRKIIDDALNGVGTPATGFTNNLEWADPISYEDNQKEEAKAELEKAGWTPGDDGIYEKDGLRCEFSVYAPTGDTARFQLAEALAAEAKTIGIQINTDQKSWDELTQLAPVSGIVWGWGQFDPIVLKNLFYSKGFTGNGYDNTVDYTNPKADELIEQAIAATDRDEVISLWKDVQEETGYDYAYLYIVNIQHTYFVKDNLDISVDTQIPHPHGHGAPIINNMNDWTISE